jgi:hypothetical protein
MIIRKDKLDGNELIYLGKGEFVKVCNDMGLLSFLELANVPCAEHLVVHGS